LMFLHVPNFGGRDFQHSLEASSAQLVASHVIRCRMQQPDRRQLCGDESEWWQ
jgi:hypothetical protein